MPGTKTAIVELCARRSASAATRSCCPIPATPTTRRASRSPAPSSALLPLDPAAGWAPDFDAAPPAAAAFLNYPSNPCAACAPPGTFEAAVAYAERTGAAIVADAAYIDLVYDGREPESFLATPGAKDVGVEMWTMSKTFGMAGWRIGFVVGNAEIVERVNLPGRPLARRHVRAAAGGGDRGARPARRTRSRSGARPTSGGATG